MSNLPVKKDERRGIPSASSIDRYFHCPGAWLLEKQVSEEEKIESKDAERGTRLHAANETGDVSGLVLTEADLLQRVRDTEARIYTNWKDEFNLKDAEIEIIRERRWWLMKSNTAVCSAKMDFVALAEKKRLGLVLDLKSGRKEVVPAPSNKQLRTSAVILTANYNLSHCRVGIVAPLQKTQPLCDYTALAIFEAWKELESTIGKTKDPNSPRVAGTWCEFCPARHICPEAQGVVRGISALAGLKWGTLTPQRKLELWDACEMAQAIVDGIKANCKAELKADPASIPGLEKRPDYSVRELSDLANVYLELVHLNIGPEEFTNLCSLSVGALTNYIRLKTGKTQKQADEWVNKHLANFIKNQPREGRVLRRKEEAK